MPPQGRGHASLSSSDAGSVHTPFAHAAAGRCRSWAAPLRILLTRGFTVAALGVGSGQRSERVLLRPRDCQTRCPAVGTGTPVRRARKLPLEQRRSQWGREGLQQTRGRRWERARYATAPQWPASCTSGRLSCCVRCPLHAGVLVRPGTHARPPCAAMNVLPLTHLANPDLHRPPPDRCSRP